MNDFISILNSAEATLRCIRRKEKIAFISNPDRKVSREVVDELVTIVRSLDKLVTLLNRKEERHCYK